MSVKQRQLHLLKREPTAYGGSLLRTRKGRSSARPLATRHSMHLVLRSSKAIGEWSFRRARNRHKVEGLVQKFSSRYGVRIHSLANVGNHIHLHIQLTNRRAYRPFIRATTAAIAMAVTGLNRWSKSNLGDIKFWDERPFTRIVIGFRAMLNLKDYIRVNQLEGLGFYRGDAEDMVRRWRSSSA